MDHTPSDEVCCRNVSVQG